MSEERSSKRQRFSGKPVAVTVGGGLGEEFCVHAPILKQHSPFFKAALDKKWQGGQELKLKLPDDIPDVFATYAEYLYHDKIGELEPSGTFVTKQELRRAKHLLLAHMYVFAEKVQDDAFCNQVMTAIIALGQENYDGEGAGHCTTLLAMKIIFERTLPGSQARRYITDCIAHLGSECTNYDQIVKDVPEAAAELLRTFARLKGTKGYESKEDFYKDSKRWYKQPQKSEDGGA